MGKEKVVVDTNILISALGWDGSPRKLVVQILSGRYELLISKKQLTEIKRVMNYSKFRFTTLQKEAFLKIIFLQAKIVETKMVLDVIKEDKSDNAILECAEEFGAEVIISGDHHLRKLGSYKNTRILSVNEFLRQIDNGYDNLKIF